MFGFPRQSRDSCTTRLFLLAHAQTKVPSVGFRNLGLGFRGFLGLGLDFRKVPRL